MENEIQKQKPLPNLPASPPDRTVVDRLVRRDLAGASERDIEITVERICSGARPWWIKK